MHIFPTLCVASTAPYCRGGACGGSWHVPTHSPSGNDAHSPSGNDSPSRRGIFYPSAGEHKDCTKFIVHNSDCVPSLSGNLAPSSGRSLQISSYYGSLHMAEGQLRWRSKERFGTRGRERDCCHQYEESGRLEDPCWGSAVADLLSEWWRKPVSGWMELFWCPIFARLFGSIASLLILIIYIYEAQNTNVSMRQHRKRAGIYIYISHEFHRIYKMDNFWGSDCRMSTDRVRADPRTPE